MIKIGSIKFTNTNKLAEDISAHIKSGKMSFDLPVQRKYVWDRKRKSEFIRNLIEGGPTFPIYINRVDGIDYVIDGQQRARTINNFIENKFSLYKLPPIEMSDGEIINISGKYYKDLSDEIRGAILGYNLGYCYGENLTNEQVDIIFVRLNSGKPLSATEMTKAQIKSVSEVNSLAKHSIFGKVMNEKGRQSSRDVGLIMQIYIALFGSYKCMLNTAIREALKETEISVDQQEAIKSCLDVVEKVYDKITEEKSDITKKLSLIFKRKVHFVAFVYLVYLVGAENAQVDTLLFWAKHFFDAPVGKTTISEEYNTYLIQATNSSESVTARLNLMYEDYVSFTESNG